MSPICHPLVALWALIPLSVPGSFFPFREPNEPPRSVQVIAHRGCHLVSPENSRRAIEMAAEDYIEWVEVDVRRSADNKHVLFHDSRLDEKTNGSGLVREKTLEELRLLDAGSWFANRFMNRSMLTLTEGLSAARNRVNLYLDCKDVDPAFLVSEVKALGMENQVVVYADRETLARIAEVPGHGLALMAKWQPGEPIREEGAKSIPLAAVEIDAEHIREGICQEFHRKGIRVEAKTLGESDQAETWLRVAKAGVDWIQTDRPVEVVATLLRGKYPDWPVAIACHRGASRYAPENTLPALELAPQLGAAYVEIDIRRSKDGGYYLCHDRTVERTTNGKGPIEELLDKEIHQLDAGGWFARRYENLRVPTLDEALSALPANAHYYLDAKAISPETLVEAVRKHALVERCVIYQSADYLRSVKRLLPEACVMPPLDDEAELIQLEDFKPYAVDARWESLSASLINRCHAAGIKVFSDALGLHEGIPHYRQAIGWGIDVIQTDHPAKLLRAIELDRKEASKR